jgi:hypothetical protein
MRQMSGLFTRYQPAYAEHGITTIPCSTDAKKPLIRNYLQVGMNGSTKLASKFTHANALGILTGRRNRLTVLDVDSTDEHLMRDLLKRYGDARIIVRTASGKFHAYYRHMGERRRIRPLRDHPIDILGDGGFVMAAPSLYGGGQYQMIRGSFADFDHLTPLRRLETVPTDAQTSDGQIREGERNKTLFRYCMKHAHLCSRLDDLLNIARKGNESNMPMLDDAEVMQIATSAWNYTVSGRNRFGCHGSWSPVDEIDQFPENTDAYYLLAFLRAHNGPDATFICANGLSEKFHWDRRRVAAARAKLIELGRIKSIRQAGRGSAALFRWPNRR